MKILLDILKEHEKNVEELKKLPKIGDVIEISRRNTSNKRGAVKETVGKFEVESKHDDNRLIIARSIDFSYVECFSFSDLLFDESVNWKYQ